MADINNDDALRAVMEDIVAQVIKIVSDRLVTMLREDINIFTYTIGSSTFPNLVYRTVGNKLREKYPTLSKYILGSDEVANAGYRREANGIRDKYPSFEFRDAFHFSDITINMQEVSSELDYHWNEMTVDKSTGQHWDGEDSRERLADILNVSGFESGKIRAPFWDIFISQVDTNIDEYFQEAFQSLGIQIA